jgi:putative ABC transport system permease protein
MGTLMQDIRFGCRMLAKNPFFTAVIVLTLSLGIGANVTVFTIVNAVLLKGLPFEESDRIISITSNNLAKNQPRLGASYPDFLDWRTQSKSFKGLGALQGSVANLTEPGLPTESKPSARVTTNTFSLLGAKPIFGRDFLPEEDQGSGSNVAIIGYRLWQKRYGGDPNVLGRVVKINEVPNTIIGVMPDGMRFPYDQDIWTPLFSTSKASSLGRRETRGVIVFGRLADGVSMSQAQSEMSLIAKRLEDEYPSINKGIGVRVASYASFFSDETIRLLFLAMLAAVGFVLLIACANVANLLLSRSITRAREISIRSALGASRKRIVRQLLVENFLLSVLGALGGLIISIWGIKAFILALPDEIPYWMTFTMDYKVFVYLAAICLATSFIFGLAPALHVSKVDISQSLKDGARGSTSGRAGILSRVLVVSEVSLALMLLVGAGLMVRSFMKLQEMSAGMNNPKVLTMSLFFSGGKYLVPEPRIAILERLEPELVNTPDVETVALASTLPLGWAIPWRIDLDGHTPPADPNDRPLVAGIEISPQYFEVLGVPVLRGRTFAGNDGRQGDKIAIVNRFFSEKFWGGQNPVGKRIGIIRETKPELWVTVIGEVADVKQNVWPNQDLGAIEPVVYVPYLQDQEARWMAILAKTKGDAHALTVPLRNAIQRVNDMAVNDVYTLPEHFARTRWFNRVFGALFVIFAGIGLILAAVGIYAVMAYGVSQRTQEIGIRMALGAQLSSIMKLILTRGLLLASIGVAIGLVGSFAVTRLMTKLLIGVKPTDPATFAVVALILIVVAAFACFIPARRAASVNPILALRAD